MTNTEAIAPINGARVLLPYTTASTGEAIWANGQELNNAAVLSHLNGQEAALVEATRDLGEARGHIAALLGVPHVPSSWSILTAARAFLRGA
jgi:hypothetical protein